MKWIVTDKNNKKMKIVKAPSAHKAIFAVAKNKKDYKNYSVELFFDHNQLQEQNIGVLGYRVAGPIPDKRKDQEKYFAIDHQLKLIGYSLEDFIDLLGLPILIRFSGGES